jgi:hypothetical protein
MVSHQRQRSPKRDFPYAKVTFLASQNPAEIFTLIIDEYYSTASQQNLPFIKSYFMSNDSHNTDPCEGLNCETSCGMGNT